MNDPDHSKQRARYDVSTADAIDMIVSAARSTGVETVPLSSAPGRVLATDLASLVDRPGADDSALDGYACRATDTLSASPTAPVSLDVIGVSHAGSPFDGTVGARQAVRIATGAVVPAGADAVVGVENAVPSAEGERVLLDAPASPEAVRRRARDLATGHTYLTRGRVLDAATVGLAAAMGHAEVTVARRPRVALLLTGDELVAPGADLARGEVYDANGPALAALTAASGAELAAVQHVRDDDGALEAAIERLTEPGGIDLVVTSGGVSRGERDVVRDLMARRGELTFWRVMVRPGGPTMFGHVAGVPVLGLPGNPVSSIVTFMLFARAYLDTALGRSAPLPYSDRRPAVADGVFVAGAKEMLHRASLVTRGPTLHVAPFDDQSSAVLRSLSESTALVVTPTHHRYAPGDTVEVIELAPHLRR